MGMKERVNDKTKQQAKERHGYEGHWLALLERPSRGPIKDKTLIREYILDNLVSCVITTRRSSVMLAAFSETSLSARPAIATTIKLTSNGTVTNMINLALTLICIATLHHRLIGDLRQKYSIDYV